MKFWYLKCKNSKGLVVADFDYSDEGSWVSLSIGFAGEQPYFGSPEELTAILNGEKNESWAYDITSGLKAQMASGEIILCEVEL